MYYLLDIVRPRVRTHTFPDRCALLGSSFFLSHVQLVDEQILLTYGCFQNYSELVPKLEGQRKKITISFALFSPKKETAFLDIAQCQIKARILPQGFFKKISGLTNLLYTPGLDEKPCILDM